MASAGNGDAGRLRRRVIVSGRVQGVFFRDSTRREAERVGVSGWVRNLDDGTVEAVFEGEHDAVQAALDFCRRGPERARVDDVVCFPGEPLEGLDHFEVR